MTFLLLSSRAAQMRSVPRIVLTCVILFLLLAPSGVIPLCYAQGNKEKIDRPGMRSKILTQGLTDQWTFEAVENDTVVVKVTTTDFDAVISLVQVVGENEKVLLELDGEGSGGAFKMRLTEKGAYKVLVRGFENRGGGDYALEFEKFTSKPMGIGEIHKGEFDATRRADFHFVGIADSYFTFKPQGRGVRKSQIVGPDAEEVTAWNNLHHIEKAGEYSVELNGDLGSSYEFELKPTIRNSLKENSESKIDVPPVGALIYEIDGIEGKFALFEIESSKPIRSQFLLAPIEKTKETSLQVAKTRPAFGQIPVGSKGKFSRYGILFGRTARYQLQIAAEVGSETRVNVQNTLKPLVSPAAMTMNLPVGSTQFFEVTLEQGKSISIKAESESFDPMIELFNVSGTMIRADDDSGGSLNSEIRLVSFKTEKAILIVKSVGNGGGGDYQLKLTSEDGKALRIGDKQEAQLVADVPDYWLVSGVKGTTAIFFVQSSQSKPRIRLYNARGDTVADTMTKDHTSNSTTVAYEFPDADSYTLSIAMPSEGGYKLRVYGPD